MRGVLAFITIVLSVGQAELSAAQECMPHRAVVSVQIHDYEHLPPEMLSEASDIVSKVYRNIGVGTEFIGVIRQDVHRTNTPPTEHKGPRIPIAQITVLILTPEMAARGRIPEDVLGLAAVPAEGMGRIAYAIYKRIQQNAADDGARVVDLLGFVMAHEIGHLLLGRGWGSDGLMKNHWARRDLQQIDPLQLAFTEAEASQIRRTILNDSWPPAAIATRGSKADDQCVIPSRDERDPRDLR